MKGHPMITILSKSVAIAAGHTMYDGIAPGKFWYVSAPDIDGLRGFATFVSAKAFAESYEMPFRIL